MAVFRFLIQPLYNLAFALQAAPAGALHSTSNLVLQVRPCGPKSCLSATRDPKMRGFATPQPRKCHLGPTFVALESDMPRQSPARAGCSDGRLRADGRIVRLIAGERAAGAVAAGAFRARFMPICELTGPRLRVWWLCELVRHALRPIQLASPLSGLVRCLKG